MDSDHTKVAADEEVRPHCSGIPELVPELSTISSRMPGTNSLEAEASAATRLTSCEREFLSWLVEGYSYKQIADSMHVSTNTVRDYVRTAYKKLSVNCRTQAAVKFLRLR